MNWNRTFTDLIRAGRAAYWGNWTLDPKIKLGAVGIVSPDTGDFTLVQEATPGVPARLAQHITSERLRHPEWLEHPNGARSISSITATVFVLVIENTVNDSTFILWTNSIFFNDLVIE